MLVEFKTVRSNLEEAYDKDVLIETSGVASVGFHNEKDYIADVTIEMENIIGFTEGRVFENSSMYPCVYADYGEGLGSPNLLITYEEFKKLFQICTDNKVYTTAEIKLM